MKNEIGQDERDQRVAALAWAERAGGETGNPDRRPALAHLQTLARWIRGAPRCYNQGDELDRALTIVESIGPHDVCAVRTVHQELVGLIRETFVEGCGYLSPSVAALFSGLKRFAEAGADADGIQWTYEDGWQRCSSDGHRLPTDNAVPAEG